MRKKEEPKPISHDYIFNDVFRKLSDTITKYRDTIPPLNDIEKAIIAGEKDDPFLLTVHILDMLKVHAANSQAVAEIFENMRKDFWHGLDPMKIKRHIGKYYITSITTNE
jgi:hypothetical protein